MMNNNIDRCDNDKCQFAGVCKRFLPRAKAPIGQYIYYLSECPSFRYFIP